MREQVIQVVEQYIEAVRNNDGAALPVHPDAVCEFPTNTYRGAASFRKGLDDFARIMKSIDVIRLVVDGEHCVAIMNIKLLENILAVHASRRSARDGLVRTRASRARRFQIDCHDATTRAAGAADLAAHRRAHSARPPSRPDSR